jgi:hypothetical protein
MVDSVGYAPTMGRKKLFTERVLVPMSQGTLARIARVLRAEEERTAFFRAAIEREIKRREAKAEKAKRQ